MGVEAPLTTETVTVDSLCAQIVEVGRTADELIKGVCEQRDEAIALLADWVARVSEVGTSWDDWDEGYKNAAYRPCGIRERLDKAIEEAKRGYQG